MSNPLSSFGYSDNDYASAVATAMAESGTRPNRNEMAGIVDVLANRLETDPRGFGARAPSIASVAQGYFGNRTQFDPWSGVVPGTRARGSVPARETLRDGLRAALNDRFAQTLDRNTKAKLSEAKTAVMAVLGSGVQRGISKGAVNFTGSAVPLSTARANEHNQLGRQNATQIGATSFYGPDHNPNTPYSLSGRVAEQFAHDVGYPEMPGTMFGIDDQAFPSGQVQYGGPLADLTPGYNDVSMGSFYGGNQPPSHSAADLGAFNGSVSDPYSFGDPNQRSGMGLGVTGYGLGDLGTPNMPGMGQYDNLPGSFDFGQTVNGAFGTPPNINDVFSGQPMGGPQSFSTQFSGLSPNGFTGGTFQPDVSDFAFGANFPGFSQNGYGPAPVQGPYSYEMAQPDVKPTGRSPMGDIEEAPQTQKGITGYTNTTHNVPNPAYADWAAQYGQKPGTISMQQMYEDDLKDKLGTYRGPMTSLPPNAVPKAPSKTLSQNVRSPVYGQVPVPGLKSNIPSIHRAAPAPTLGLGWGGDDGYGGFMSGNTAMAQMGNFSNFGLQGFNGTFGTGLSPPGQQPLNSPFGGFFNGLDGGWGLGGWGSGAANVGSGWGNSGSQGGIGGAGGFSGGDAGYGSDARSGRDGADQGNN